MKLDSKSTSRDILKIIKQRGHFEIRIIPSFDNKLKLDDLEEIVREKQIKYRSIYYPHIANHDFGKFQKRDDYIESFYHWGHTAQIWRFSKSGQFEHYIGFVEDRWNNDTPLTKQEEPYRDKPMPKNTFFEPVVKIWEITEMILFATQLAELFKCKMTIEIKLHKMENRKMEIRTVGRSNFDTDYICNTDTVTLNSLCASYMELWMRQDELIEDKMVEIYGHFGWKGPHIRLIIKGQQEKLYTHSA